MTKKGQVALEYMAIIVFLLIVTTSVLYMSGQKISEAHVNNKRYMMNEISEVILGELYFATLAEDGYKSVFKLPTELNGVYYNITVLNNSMLLLNYDYDDYGYSMLNGSIGSLCYDTSTPIYVYEMQVTKDNGVAILSSCLTCTVSYQYCSSLDAAACAALPIAVRNQCQKGYCKCI